MITLALICIAVIYQVNLRYSPNQVDAKLKENNPISLLRFHSNRGCQHVFTLSSNWIHETFPFTVIGHCLNLVLLNQGVLGQTLPLMFCTATGFHRGTFCAIASMA